MNEADEIKELKESIKLLADMNETIARSLKMLGEQNMVFSHAITVLSGSIKSQDLAISEDLIEIAIKNLRDNYGLNPPRDKLLRDILFGDPRSAPMVPDFTVIRGGKDDPAGV